MVTTISTAAVLAGAAVSTSTVIAVTKTIAMTTLQKTVITATLATAVGTGIFEAHQVSQMREQNQTLQQQEATLAEQIQQLQRERDDATKRWASLLAENEQLKSNPNATELLKLRSEVTRLRNEANDPAGSAAKAWLAKVNKLKQRLEETPGAKIPEFQFLTEQDWFDATRGKLDSEADYRRALAQLRNTAKNEFAPLLSAALKKYLQANNDTFPSDVTLLQPYFDSQVDGTMLSRWGVLSAETVPNMKVGKDWVIAEKAPVDDVFDSQIIIGSNGYGASDYLAWETQKIMPPVWAAFQSANNGQGSSDPSQLLPYATTPEQHEAIQKLILKNSANP